MKKLFTILTFLVTTICFGQNTIKAIYVPDIARDFVQFTTTASAGTMPSTSAFTVNGVNPSEVIKTNDTLVSLRMGSDFTMGASVSVNYTAPGGGQLGGMSSFTGRGVDNQITAGVVHHWTTTGHQHIFHPPNDDFNTFYAIDSGDIVELDFGEYYDFDVTLMTGVRFVAKYSSTGDSVLFKYFNIREQVIHSGLFGHPAMPTRNIHIRSMYAGNFGVDCSATGNIWLENLEIYNVSQGIHCGSVSDLHFPPYNLSRLNYQALVTKNIRIQHSSEEAFYIGSFIPAPLIPIRWTVFGCEVDSIGRDAYQFRNGSVWLKNCIMHYIGLTAEDPHSHGFLFGTTSTGAYVENLVGDNVRGYGIFVNGYGVVTVKDCHVSSGFNTIFVKNYDDQDSYNIGGLIFNLICTSNWFDCTTDPGGYSLDVRRDPAKTSVIVNVNSATTFINPIYVEDGVHGGVNNGVQFRYTGVCKNTGFIN